MLNIAVYSYIAAILFFFLLLITGRIDGSTGVIGGLILTTILWFIAVAVAFGVRSI